MKFVHHIVKDSAGNIVQNSQVPKPSEREGKTDDTFLNIEDDIIDSQEKVEDKEDEEKTAPTIHNIFYYAGHIIVAYKMHKDIDLFKVNGPL